MTTIEMVLAVARKRGLEDPYAIEFAQIVEMTDDSQLIERAFNRAMNAPMDEDE
jgi:hypothetical protein